MQRSSAYIQMAQLVLWALALISSGLLLFHRYIGFQTLEVFSTTLAGVQIGVGLRFDILSALLFFMITLLGATIGHYSHRYLDGETKQPYFYKYLIGIILAASLLVLSSNLLMFFVMWLATSYNLHKLLIYYSDRPQAMMAARKKAIVSRIGDIALFSAIILIYKTFGSFEFSDLFAAAASMDANAKSALSMIGILLALGALTKSAQFPFHFWLPDTMESPTPVSALMHAGVINAGGLLIIRMSPMLQYDVATHLILAPVGAFSAAFGALCMIVQNDIKKKLAYSTVSQMGMMMLACGLGAYSIALFHIFAHSFYKAYAFLSTGKLVEESKKAGFEIKTPSMTTVVLAGMAGLSVIALGSLYEDGADLPAFTYCAILLLGFFQHISMSKNFFQPLAFLQVALTSILAVFAYSQMEYALNNTLHDSLAYAPSSAIGLESMLGLSVSTFLLCLASFFLSTRLMNIDTPFLEKTYMYLRNGGYMGLKSSVLLARIYPFKTATY